MTPPTALILLAFLLALTVGALAAAVVAGLRRKRRLHIALVVIAVCGLVITIAQAYSVGSLYDLEATGATHRIHRFFARLSTLFLVAPAALGVATLRNPSVRPWHRRLAFVSLALLGAATVSGVTMMVLASPLPS